MVEIEVLPLSEITEAHLRDLAENSVAESRTLEFKRAAVGSNNNDKKEFLKDVTALANTAGGLLIYGIVERDSVADGVIALVIPSIDKEILRLQNILKDAVEPRLTSVEMREVPLNDGGFALLVKVPQSWRPPHRVVFDNSNRFYLRHSKGVFEPDTEGLRQVFNSSLDQERQLEAWRDDRLNRLKSGVRGFKVSGNGVVLVQVASLARGQANFQIPSVQKCNLDFLPPVLSSSTHRWNFDGLLIHAPQARDDTVIAYTQIFPSWKVEMAGGDFIEQINGVSTLRFSILVHSIYTAVYRSIKGMIKHGGIGPFAVAVTISGLAGSTMQSDYRAKIDRDNLLFPLLIVPGEATGNSLQERMLPIWDSLWQAYDHENCTIVRDENGSWKGFPKGIM